MSFIDKLPFWFNKQSEKELGASLIAIDRELKLTYEDIKALRDEFDLRTATSIWLDEHGSWYGVPRLPNELDNAYRDRIWREITKGRLTIPAILETVGKILGQGGSAYIREPYKYIFKYNISQLSEDHMIQDGIYYSHGVIDIVISGPIPDGLLDIIDDLRAGGVIVYISSTGELHEGPLKMYYPDAKNRPDYHHFIELICRRSHADGFILDESMLGDTRMLSGGGTIRTMHELFYDLVMAEWLRHPNTPTISYSPEYDVPDDTEFYFNSTRTDKVFEFLIENNKTDYPIISATEKSFDLSIENQQTYPIVSDTHRSLELKTTDKPEYPVIVELGDKDTELLIKDIQIGKVVSSIELAREMKPLSMAPYFKVGSVLKIEDLIDTTIDDLTPELSSVLVEVQAV